MPRPRNRGRGFFERLFGVATIPHSDAGRPHDMHVVSDPARCVQCGVCGYNCPVGIPVRDYARQGKIVDDARCVQCGQCVEACPRGTLRWGSIDEALGVGDRQKSRDTPDYAAASSASFEMPAGEREAGV